MTCFGLLSPSSPLWPELLDRVPHDVYHTAGYHQSPQLGRGGDPTMFYYREGEQIFAWPFLMESIEGTEYFDVTSVYGYAGPVTNGDTDFVARASRELLAAWDQLKVVTAFTRFHPLLANATHAASLPAADSRSRLCGATIAIDLTLPLVEQTSHYQKVLRQQIRKCRGVGLTTTLDETWQHADDFLRIYSDTMDRRGSKNDYRIDAAWLAQFRGCLGDRARLFVTKLDGQVAAGLLTMDYGPYLHAHLTGSAQEFLTVSPLKVLLDDVRMWGFSEGLSQFHLGGGLGGQRDSLFEFKRKFSNTEFEFHIGAWVLNPAVYRALSGSAETEFFPAYRACATITL